MRTRKAGSWKIKPGIAVPIKKGFLMKYFRSWFLWILFIMFVSLIVQPVFAGTSDWDSDQIDQFVQTQMTAARIPGLALVITQNGEVVYLKAFGSDGRGAYLTPQTPMLLGSLSKSFTALAVMQLAEDGLVDLDAPISDYIPGFSNVDLQQSAQITVRHLLNQTSGMNDLGYPASLTNFSTLAERVNSLKTAVPNAEAGTIFQYFNPNYSVLGFLVEQVSGQPYGNYMQKRVFNPLSMQQASAYPSQVQNLAQGHTLFLGAPRTLEQEMPLSEVSAGFIVVSAQDMGTYLLAQAGRMEAIISTESLSKMHTPPKGIDSPYGMGWFVESHKGVDVISHTGDLQSFHAYAALLPEQDIQFAYLINQNGLLPSLITFPPLRNGLLDILTGLQPGRSVSTNLINIILVVVIFYSLIRDMKRYLNIPVWAKSVKDHPKKQVIINIALEFIIPIALFVFIPFLMQVISGRKYSWNLLYQFAPDLTLWLFVGIAISLSRGFRKTLTYLRTQQESE
jgi:CubicO group peptidase (beta-lactamase class C family)